MTRSVRILAATVLVCLGASTAQAGDTRAASIIERFRHANEWRGHVMVVAHRGGWMENGEIRLAENSLSSLKRAIELGVEMVEVDVQRTSDGAFVVLHDETLERTTTCEGKVAEQALEQVRTCRLVIEGTGEETQETVPTLRAFLEAAKDRIMVNLDSKLGIESLSEMAAMARELGMSEQIVAKAYVDTPEQIEAARRVVEAMGPDAQFMPQLNDAVSKDLEPMRRAAVELRSEAMELRNTHELDGPLTEDGGLFFSMPARALAARHDFHLWINTLYDRRVPGLRSGGRGDEVAVEAKLPGEVYGFWAAQGATMIQTDEQDQAIEWLTRNGYRIPYE